MPASIQNIFSNAERCRDARRKGVGAVVAGAAMAAAFLLLIKYSLPLLAAWAWPRVCEHQTIALSALRLTNHANSSSTKENSVGKRK